MYFNDFFNNMITIKIRCLNHYIIKNKLAFVSALDNKSFSYLNLKIKYSFLPCAKLSKNRNKKQLKNPRK